MALDRRKEFSGQPQTEGQDSDAQPVKVERVRRYLILLIFCFLLYFNADSTVEMPAFAQALSAEMADQPELYFEHEGKNYPIEVLSMTTDENGISLLYRVVIEQDGVPSEVLDVATTNDILPGYVSNQQSGIEYLDAFRAQLEKNGFTFNASKGVIHSQLSEK